MFLVTKRLLVLFDFYSMKIKNIYKYCGSQWQSATIWFPETFFKIYFFQIFLTFISTYILYISNLVIAFFLFYKHNWQLYSLCSRAYVDPEACAQQCALAAALPGCGWAQYPAVRSEPGPAGLSHHLLPRGSQRGACATWTAGWCVPGHAAL